jgi:hypothetical protein
LPDPRRHHRAILLPDGALDIDASDSSAQRVVRTPPDDRMQRALRHRQPHLRLQLTTYSATPLDDIIWGFGFNDLPQAARTYIATAAARRFQAQKVNSPILDRFDAEDEERAFLAAPALRAPLRDTNSFRRSPSLQKWTGRRSF